MPKVNSNISRFNLAYLFTSIIWHPLQVYYLHIDGKGLTLMFFTIMAVVVNIVRQDSKVPFKFSTMICWMVLATYSFINSLFNGYLGETLYLVFLNTSFLEPTVFMWITIVELMRNKERCLRVFLAALILYMIIGSMHFVVWREGGERIAAEGLGNDLPFHSVTTLLVASVLYLGRNLRGGLISFITIISLSLYVIIMSATRNAFGASLIILVGTALARIKRFNFKNIVFIIVLGFVLYNGVNYIMNHSFLGQRFEEEAPTSIITLSSNPMIDDFMKTFLGDRYIQYVEAISVHHKKPITGIGLGNFQQIADFPYRLHSEYMVQYCENGLIGFWLLLLFYFLIIVGLIRKRKSGYNTRLYSFALIAILFLNFTTWTYNHFCLLLIYAIILNYIYSKEAISTPPR